MMNKGILLMILPLLLAFQGNTQTNPFKAPLYWSVYEYHIIKEQNGEPGNYIPENVLMNNASWVSDNLLPLGYEMICIDGWGDVNQINEHGYRSSHSVHWEHDFEWWAGFLQDEGMNLGMYGNPLWIHVAEDDLSTMISGTNIPVSSLIDPDEEAYFTWVQVDRPGAEEYVKGYVQYYADMGIDYFRIDFLSWYEDGWDRYMGTVGPERPRAHYEIALQWMREAADANGMFLSLVMPHLYFEAEAEKMQGHMFRVNEDTGEGGWWKWNEKDRGEKREGWSVYANPVDGLTYWSYLSGIDSIILDPDFIRLNTFANYDEKKSVISLCLLAGGALTVADQYNTIGSDLWLYKNSELLELNWEGFVGKPLTNNPEDENSQVWLGQLPTEEWVVGLFNRENTTVTRSIDFSELGIEGIAQVRDLWLHENLPSGSNFTAEIPPHGCRVIKVVPQGNGLTGPDPMHLEELNTSIEWVSENEYKGLASVLVVDKLGNPIAGASVSVLFSATFNEKATSITDDLGVASVYTTMTDTGIIKVNACVVDVDHPDYIYAGDQNILTCLGDQRYYAGTFTNWQLMDMSYSQGWWQKDSVIMLSGNQEMKFANTNNWSGDDWGNAQGLSGIAQLSTGGDPNISFSIDYGGMYDLDFNEETLVYSVIKSDVEKLNDDMYVAGTFTDWTLVPMFFDSYQWKIENLEIPAGNHELKFANTPDWSGDDWGNNQGMTGLAQLATGGDPNISFTTSDDDDYSLFFNDISLEYSIYNPSLSEEYDKNKEILVFPNPTKGILYIDIEDNSGVDIVLYNILGQKVPFIKNGNHLDISSFNQGLYHLYLQSKKSSWWIKILKTD